MNLLHELKRSYKHGSILIQLIYINIAVFVFAFIFDAFYPGNGVGHYILGDILGVHSSASSLLLRFWTPFTYMFTHFEFLHILFNLLWLYWFGTIFLQYFTKKDFLGVYLLGGFSGALVYLLAYNTIPVLTTIDVPAIGASASVTAIVIATAFYKPNMIIQLMFLGPVKLKYIALVVVGLDVFNVLISFSSEEMLYTNNLGGHIAHIGGAIFGYYYIEFRSKGTDIAKGFNNKTEEVLLWFDKFSISGRQRRAKTNFKVKYKQERPRPSREMTDIEYNTQKKVSQEEIDKILEKISKSGYDALTKEEKNKLFSMGQK